MTNKTNQTSCKKNGDNILPILAIRFKDYLISEKQLSENTVYSYYNDIKQFTEYLANQASTPEDLVFIDTLDNYIIYLYANNISHRSLVRKLSSISIFLKFLKTEGIITKNISYLLNRPKIEKKLPDYLTLSEIESLIDAFDITKPEGIRDRTLFELMYSCGLRVSEASHLNTTSIYVEESILQVIGKGDKERYVPVGERAMLELKNYIVNARVKLLKKDKKSNALFLNYRGDRLTRKGIWKNLKQASIKAGLDTKTIKVHTIRHSFATHLIQNGADLRSVQALLGHKNILTTEIYTHLDLKHIKKAYKTFHSHGA